MKDRLDPALLRAELQARRDRDGPALDRAVWCLALGEPDEGLSAIRRHLAEAARDPDRGERWRAELAVLVGDWETAAREASLALRDVTPDFVPGYREFAAAMLSLIAGDEEGAREQCEKLEGQVAARERLRSGHPALVSEIPRGLLERDADRIAVGVEALLAWHLRRARARSEIFNSARGVICLDAIVALLLAHRRGLSVPVETAYRAARLPLLALHVVEWEGQPLPRGLPFGVDADLVAGSWLQGHGLDLGEPPAASSGRTTTRARRVRSRGAADAGEDFVRQSLRLSLQAGEGNPWQLASWALMLGDDRRGRAQLERAAADAHRRWRATAPQQGRGLRWLWQSQGLPNANYVREHFGLALILGDEDALAETAQLLDAWARARAADQQRRGGPPFSEGRYGHVGGYVDLLSTLLRGGTPGPTRADAQEVRGPRPSAPVACVGLVERDATLVSSALDDILGEHARTLERRSSPPPPVCEPAAHVAAAARRLGLPVEVDESYADHLVPIEIRNLRGHEGRFGRLPCDLLGRALWDRR